MNDDNVVNLNSRKHKAIIKQPTHRPTTPAPDNSPTTPELQRTPPFITIPTPMHTPRPRGVAAVRGPHSLGLFTDNMRVRLSQYDRRNVERAAKKLGMDRAEFIRWCCVHAAKQINDGN